MKKKKPMPLGLKVEPRRVWVVECPSCHRPIDFTGEGGVYFPTKKNAIENTNLWWGTAGATLTEICGCDKRPNTGRRRP